MRVKELRQSPREIFDKESTKEKRRDLKKNQTNPEEIMWSKLRNRQFMNLKFRRQYGIGEYIADFYCAELKLVIEIDGESHFTEEGIKYDEIRTTFMKSLGIKVIRFTNKEIMENIEGIFGKLMIEVRS
jgi:very-short-patch-repair endonuclease